MEATQPALSPNTLFWQLRRHRLLPDDMTQHPFFKRHYDFLLFTILPGYKETVGIGDSSPTWFYGPESQLHFLDTYVLHSGEANWLAQQIRERRVDSGRLKQGKSQVWSTLHTELLWYNTKLIHRPPTSNRRSLLHVFSDWGVATYGGGTPAGHTFLSFKCGLIHGRSANALAKMNTTWIKGWDSFNAGHEHPDQGSFVFFPEGKPVITEALYGPKKTSLNNALMFGPVSGHHCAAPYQGQLGECGQWFEYWLKETQAMFADILTASEEDGLVFMAGEYARAYSPSLHLSSVFRATLLLSKNTLLVLDSVTTSKNPNAVGTSTAFFHNIHTPFVLDTKNSAHVSLDEQTSYTLHWMVENNKPTKALTSNISFPAEAGPRTSNFINVSFPLNSPGSPSRIAWLFAPSDLQVGLDFVDVSADGVSVQVRVADDVYRVSIATEHEDVHRRFAWLGSGGFAHVSTSRRVHRFGIGTSTLSSVGFNLVEDPDVAMAYLLLTASIISLGVVILMFVFLRRLRRRTFLYNWLQLVFIAWALLLAVTLFVSYPDSSTTVAPEERNPNLSENDLLPKIVVSGLPGSGVEVLQLSLNHSIDLRTVDLNSMPRLAFEPHHLELDTLNHPLACPWRKMDAQRQRYPLTAGWLKTMMREPNVYFRHLLEQPSYFDQLSAWMNEHGWPRWREKNGCTALIDSSGVWSSRAGWLEETLGPASRSVLLVRDPRSWVVQQLLQEERRLDKTFPALITLARRTMTTASQQSCHDLTEFKELSNILSSGDDAILKEPPRFLAALWAINTRLSLRSASCAAIYLEKPATDCFVLRFEDLLEKTEETAEHLFRWLKLPLRPAFTHRLLSLIHTDRFVVQPHGAIRSEKELHLWKKAPLSVTYTVQDVCDSLMTELGYSLKD